MSNMKPFLTLASGLIVVAAVVGVGVLKTLDLLDDDSTNTAISLLVGLLGGLGIGTVGRKV